MCVSRLDFDKKMGKVTTPSPQSTHYLSDYDGTTGVTLT